MTTKESRPMRVAPFEVPVVDISAYVGNGTPPERAAAASAVDKACRTVGFIQIVGHGVPQSAIDGLTSAMDDFFALPLEVKKESIISGVNRGYSAPKTERLSLSLGVESATKMNDFFEAFNIGQGVDSYPELDLPPEHYADNVWPTRVPGFAEGTLAWFAEAGRVARTLTAIFADALGLPAGYFGEYTDHSLDVLRMNTMHCRRARSNWTVTSPGWVSTRITGSSRCSGPTGSRDCRCWPRMVPGMTCCPNRVHCWSIWVT